MEKGAYSQRANPLAFVVDIEYAPLRQISILPGIKKFGDKINEAIANLNQLLTTYHVLLTEIRSFKFSRDSEKNIILSSKLTTGLDLSSEEQQFANVLYRYQEVLHFDVISDEHNKGLHYWHKELTNLLAKLEQDTLNKISNMQR